jgi:hypothetical protein
VTVKDHLRPPCQASSGTAGQLPAAIGVAALPCENFLYGFKGACGASRGRPGSAPGPQAAGTGALDRRDIPPPPAGTTGILRSPGGSDAAPFRAGALRARRLPRFAGQHPAATGTPPSRR